jgi:hypothetical protein
MRHRVTQCLAILSFLTLTIPVWARTYTAPLSVSKNAAIGGTQLKAGDYQLTADPDKKEVEVLQNGKVLATVPGQWVKLPQKPQYSTVIFDGDKITQVQFSGTDQALQVQ